MTIVIGRYRASILRKHTNKCLREFSEDLGIKSVLNLGAKPDDSDKEGGTYEGYFPGARFLTLDLAAYDHERHVQGDMMDPPSGLGQFDLVIASSMLEHVDRPWIAAPYISALVKPGGYLFIAMPWFYPVHEGPYFGDHWRATPSGMRFLFEDLNEVRMEFSPSSIIAVRDRKTYWNDVNSTASGYCMLLKKPAKNS